MFTTREVASKLTDRDIPTALLQRAQSVIETYIGRTELQIEDNLDKVLLARAVGYQAAYMQDNEDLVYQQVSAQTTGQNDSLISFKQGDNASPWIAPLAVMACRNLSFKRSRSVTTGKVTNNPYTYAWRTI
jgi:hypothetical protein